MTSKAFIQKMSDPLKRSPFYCRPLCYLVFIFLAGLFLLLVNKIMFAVYCFVVAIYCTYNLIKSRNALVFVTFTVIFLLFALLCGLRAEQNYLHARRFNGQTVTVNAKIDEVICNEVYLSSYYASLNSINGEACGGQIIIEFPFETELLPFDTVELTGEATDARKAVSGSMKMNCISKDRVLEIEGVKLISVSGEAKSGFMYRVYTMQTAIAERFDSVLGHGASSYAKALFLGDTDGMSTDLRNDMSALGVSHILAVSGMHTSILAGIVIAVCERLRMHRRMIAVLVTVSAVIFMFLAGLSPSIVRAVIMLTMSLLPTFFGRRGDSITSLFCAIFIICSVSPESIMSCSLLLSFASCLAIVMCIPSLDRVAHFELYSARDGKLRTVFRYIRKFLSAIGVSAVCSLVAAPLVALYFDRTSLVSVPANLVAVPLSTFSMVVMIPLLAFVGVPYLGSGLAYIFTALYDLMRHFADKMAGIENIQVSLRYPFFVPIIILMAVMFLFIRLNGVRRRSAFIAPFLICAVIFMSAVQIYTFSVKDRAEAVYMTTKSSEGFLVVSGSDTMYVDIGIGGKALPRAGAELSDESYCTVDLDGVMLTHYHSGHISVVRDMILNYGTKTLYLPEPENDNDTEVLDNILRVSEGRKTVMYKRGESVGFGNVTLNTSEYSLLERSAHPVLTLEIDLGQKQLLWVGSSVTESDVAFDAENLLSRAEAVIVGRHGPTMKEYIKFYSDISENIPIFVSPYADEWIYGFEVAEAVSLDDEGIGICVFK